MRGVEGREIFVCDDDRWRGIFSLYEFNNLIPVTIRRQREKREQFKEKVRRRLAPAELTVATQQDQRDKLVEILAFVFMPNHIHLLLRQLKFNGVSFFMQKFGSGYANFFNKKYQRKGHLFQSKFRESHIDGDEYLKTVLTYIHTNPISIIEPGWKEAGIRNPSKVIEFLEEYRWSSYLDYLEKKNFPSVTERDFIQNIFGSFQNIKEFVDARIYSSRISQI
ncbi:MAG: transposase [Candidatus Nealsonbacteria bacterium DGGOD1a]|nr:MAG: transposase [Candidatus Nealsonbacteria bacterium DGGOD1a]